jgi:hypothetical protein
VAQRLLAPAAKVMNSKVINLNQHRPRRDR